MATNSLYSALLLTPPAPQYRWVTEDEYLNDILVREHVDNGPLSPVRAVQTALDPLINTWANGRLLTMHPSGSFMKGTAVFSGTDIDLFISLEQETIESLQEIHDKLFRKLTDAGYSPKRQNVSLNIKVGSYSVDLVPAKRQNGIGLDHSIINRKTGTWSKTNVYTHINTVIAGGRQRETQLLKLWRNQKSLDFPSFYLELVVIRALESTFSFSIANRIRTVFQYLEDSFVNARFVDPANTNNILSDELTQATKQQISRAAGAALVAPYWRDIIL
jgi:hypothetical protein